MLILLFLCDFTGTWQPHTQRLCGPLIRRHASCGWSVHVPALPTNPCSLNRNQRRIIQTHTHTHTHTHTAGQEPHCGEACCQWKYKTIDTRLLYGNMLFSVSTDGTSVKGKLLLGSGCLVNSETINQKLSQVSSNGYKMRINKPLPGFLSSAFVQILQI